jgi:hypothetical protein
MGRAKPLSEDDQYEAYRSVLARMAPRRVIIRTADIGSDKPAAGWESPVEPNPALGLRGISPLSRMPQRACWPILPVGVVTTIMAVPPMSGKLCKGLRAAVLSKTG